MQVNRIHPIRVAIIGAGLAGCEAAFQLAAKGFSVELYEMRPSKMTEAHKTDCLCELVCSNSLKSDNLYNSAGLLKSEMRLLNSLVVRTADLYKVDAGLSLAVDRDIFSKSITDAILSNSNIKLIRSEVANLDHIAADFIIIGTGPLTSEVFADFIKYSFGQTLYFYDAIAPIVNADTIDFDQCFFASRYDKGGPDFLNCPLNRDQFDDFYEALINAGRVAYKPFEDKRHFESCLPIEEMADRGKETLLFGPLKPVGLYKDGKKFYAVVQLRKENAYASAYNIVGFQTKMKYNEQMKVFRKIPALRYAEFFRLGSMHRNTYLNSPEVLGQNFSYKLDSNIYFAGALTGVEGYIESAASGLIVAYDIVTRIESAKRLVFPVTTALNALSNYHLNYKRSNFVPTNFHFGLLPPLPEDVKDKKQKKMHLSSRALVDLKEFLNS